MKTIRLSDDELKAVLDRLDSAEGDSGKKKRRAERYEFRVKGCVLTIQSPGVAASTAYLVPTRDISAGGMSFLHGGFIYPGTKCTAQLISKYGTWKNVDAKVVRCVYVSGSVHEVGIEFLTAIDPAEFCSQAVKTRILLVEDDQSIARLAKLFLAQLKADIDHAANGQQAVDLASKNMYDAVLMDVDMPVMDGLTATKKLRSLGYSGVIVATTALTQPGDSEKCIAAGCDRYIAKPYDKDMLSALVESLKQEPLVSSMAQDASMTDIIREFVAELPPKLHKIESAILANDLPGLEKLCRQLKGEAGGYGFEPISSAAAAVEKSIIDKSDMGNIKRAAEQLIKLCYLARSSPRRDVRPGETAGDAAQSDAEAVPASNS